MGFQEFDNIYKVRANCDYSYIKCSPDYKTECNRIKFDGLVKFVFKSTTIGFLVDDNLCEIGFNSIICGHYCTIFKLDGVIVLKVYSKLKSFDLWSDVYGKLVTASNFIF